MNELFSKMAATARAMFPGVTVECGITSYQPGEISYHVRVQGKEVCKRCGHDDKLDLFTCGVSFESVLAKAKERARAAGVEVVEADNA